jgi:hypothetical protein
MPSALTAYDMHFQKLDACIEAVPGGMGSVLVKGVDNDIDDNDYHLYSAEDMVRS